MPTMDLGKVVGEQGPTGERGSVWYTGTGVTGTSTSGTVMPSSGIENARTNDMYLNTGTNDIYICVLSGDANTAQWAWSGNIKGNTGNPGPAGPTGSVDENTPIPFTQAILRENIASNEAIAIMFGKIAKWFNDFGTAAWASVVNNGTTFSEGTVLDGRMGKALTDSIGTLTNLETTEKSSLVGAINELTNAINELNGKLPVTQFYGDTASWIQPGTINFINPDLALRLIRFGPFAYLTGQFTTSRTINPMEAMIVIPAEISNMYAMSLFTVDDTGNTIILSLNNNTLYSDTGIEAGKSIKFNILYPIATN